MKNLKKVLAMVLVVAMVASFAVTASATSFTDDASINYSTAVEVLSGLGVISGKTDGAFHPTDDVTRGQFAKMAAYVLNGGVDAAASYGSSATTAFSDVASGKYYTAGIGYVVNKGLVDGFTDGTFRPDNSVTGVQAAKILLTALGYSSSIEGYTGTGWAQNVQADAEDAGLFAGMDTVNLTANLTREEAAQMIWNALKATTVSYAVSGTTITTSDGTTITTGASAATPVTTGAVATYTDGSATQLELVEKCFGGLTVATGNDTATGRPITTYTKIRGTSPIATVTATPALTYTTSITPAKITKALGLTVDQTADIYTVDENGRATSASQTVAVTDTNGLTGAGNGVLTEVYTNAAGAITDIVIIAPALGTVTNVTSRAANATTGAYTQYTISGNSYRVFSSVVDEDVDLTTAVVTGTVATNDDVLYYVDGDGVAHIEALSTIEGVVTAYASATGAYTVGGTARYAAAAYAGRNLTVSADSKEFYVDSYGYIVGDASTVVPTTVAVLGNDNYNVVASDGRATMTYHAIVAKADGTVETLTVASTQASLAQGLYTYTAPVNGVYTLTPVVGPVAVTDITTANATLTVTGGTGYANAKTLFVFADYDSTTHAITGTVTTVTGIANVGTYTGLTATYAIKAQGSDVASVVFVLDEASAINTVTKLTYALGTYTQTSAGYAFDVIIDGKADTIIMGANNALAANTLYSNITVGANTATAAGAANGNSVQNVGGLLFVDGTYFNVSIADSTPVYVFDGTGVDVLTGADITSLIDETTYGVTSIDVYVTSSTGAATGVYIILNP